MQQVDILSPYPYRNATTVPGALTLSESAVYRCAMPYSVVEVDVGSLIGDEQLGSKPKVWFQRTDGEWLFKEARPGTGEDWSEKVAAEIAARLSIRAAIVELAVCRNRIGSAGKSFVDRTGESLIHGNELLAGQITGYDRNKRQRQTDHTLENIVGTIRKLFPNTPDLRDGALNTLAGYVTLDALIGNTDRHHENWGLLNSFRQGAVHNVLTIAPSFDHASSLGRELTDDGRARHLLRGVGYYVRRGHGGIYLRSEDTHGANPLRLVEVAARAYPTYFTPTLENLARVPLADLCSAVDEVPADRMSAGAKTFARDMLTYNYRALLEITI